MVTVFYLLDNRFEAKEGKTYRSHCSFLVLFYVFSYTCLCMCMFDRYASGI